MPPQYRATAEAEYFAAALTSRENIHGQQHAPTRAHSPTDRAEQSPHQPQINGCVANSVIVPELKGEVETSSTEERICPRELSRPQSKAIKSLLSSSSVSASPRFHQPRLVLK